MAPPSYARIVSDALGKRKRNDSNTNRSMKKLVSNADITSALTTFPSSPYIGGRMYTTSRSVLGSSVQLRHDQSSFQRLVARPMHALPWRYLNGSETNGRLPSTMTQEASLKAFEVAKRACSASGAADLEIRSKVERLEAEINRLRQEMKAMQRDTSQWQPKMQEGNQGKLKEQYGQIVQKVEEQRGLRRMVDEAAIAGVQREEETGGIAPEVTMKSAAFRGGITREDGGLLRNEEPTSSTPAADVKADLLKQHDRLLEEDREQKSRDLEIKLLEANLAVQTQQRLKLTEEVDEEESVDDEGEAEVTEELSEGETEEEGGESEGDETAETRFGSLSEEEEELVDQILDKPASSERCVFHEVSNLELTRTQLHCLRPETWLNDEVINLYMVLLKERENRDDFQEERDHPVCHFFNSFFYNKLRMDSGEYCYKQVQRWTRRTKYKLRKCDKVLVPIHQGLHWALAVINLRDRQLEYFDSVCDGQSYPFSTKSSPETVLDDLAQYIEDESNDKNTGPLDTSGWRRVFHKDTPNQTNSSDCGMFMLKFADFVSKDAPITFSQTDMWHFRRKLVVELVHLRAD